MQEFIIKFPDGKYLVIMNNKHYKSANIQKAYIYCPKILANQALMAMQKFRGKAYGGCVVVDKYEELKLINNTNKVV